jgi:eight-cysteine-cluster-containing protein
MKYLKLNLTLLVILAILAGGYFLLFDKNTVPENKSASNVFDNSDVQVQIRDMSSVPAEYFSGNSTYSNGSCKFDKDCFNLGCNLEMCTSNKDIMTACVINGEHPDRDRYSCGCIKDVCGWYLK